MARKKNNKDTIQHKLYRNAYLRRRDDVIYTHIHFDGKQIRKTTNLTWCSENFEFALRILENRYIYLTNPKDVIYDLNDLYEDFINLKSKSVSENSILKYRQAWNNFIKKDYTSNQMIELKRDIIVILTNTHLSNNSAIKQLDQLSAFFRYCLENKYIDTLPIVKSIYPKSNKIIPTAYTLDEINLLQNSFPIGSDVHNLIKLIKNTGMRVNEAVTLKKGNLFDDYILINGKGGNDRVFPIFPDTELYDLVLELKAKKKPFNFKNSKRAGDKLVRLQKKIGMQITGFHAIRKYYENMLIDSGVPLKVAAQLLGHTIAIQSKHYITNLSQKDLRNELEKIKI